MEFECSIDGAAVRAVQLARDGLARARHAHRSGCAPSTSPATSTRRPRSALWEIVSAPTATITSGPAGRILPGQQGPPAPSTEERAIFTFTADQPDATFECAVDGAEFAPCTSPYVAFAVTDGEHEFEVRGVSDLRTVDGEPIVQEPATSYEWLAVLGPDADAPGHHDHVRAGRLDARLDRDVRVHAAATTARRRP